MGRMLGLGVAALMVILGVIWTLQGLGYIDGSSMSNERTWAVLGPITAGFGCALGIVVLQNSRRG